jgi:hypothetical protein
VLRVPARPREPSGSLFATERSPTR